VIEFGVVGEPATLDPYAPDASDLTYALIDPVFPMPFRRLADGSIEPDLAASVDVFGDTARLELNHRRWSNGAPITPLDVVRSIERATAPSGFAAIRSARRGGPWEVVLRGRVRDWERTLSRGAYVLPRGRLRGGNVSAGPFKFSRYVRGRSITYASNPGSGVKPYVDAVRVNFVQGTDLLVRLLQEGRLDAAAIPSSVNLDDRLDELHIPFDKEVGDEQIGFEFDPERISRGAQAGVMSSIDMANLGASFIRDDGRVSDAFSRAGTAPSSLSIAAPEGDELLGLIQRAVQVDLEESGVGSELITAPASTIYGAWRGEGQADVSLLRVFAVPRGPTWIPLASVATFVAWREEVHGIAVNPSLSGPLWNAAQWWKDPSI
jgi:hypothetical protein